MGFFNRMIKESSVIHELEINGKRQEDEDYDDYSTDDGADTPEDPDAPVDYTNDTDDDSPPEGDTAEDNTSAEPEAEPGADPEPGADNTDDYTIPDDATPEDQPAEPEGADTPEDPDAPVDYTQDDGGDTGDSGTEPDIDYTQDDTSTDGGDTAGDDGDIDYSADDGGDPSGGDTADGTDPATDDGTGGSAINDELKTVENDILADLSDEQKQIQSDELRTNFIELYNVTLDAIDKVNNVSKREDTLDIFEFISAQLIYLKDIINTNITRTFDTKTYFENNVSFQQCLAILNLVKKLIDETNKKVEQSKND